MCNLNILCKVSDGTCTCAQSECHGIIKPVPVPLYNPQEGTMILSLFRMISQQNEMIKRICEDTRSTVEAVNKLAQNLGVKHSAVEVATDEVTNSEQLKKMLCPDSLSHEYSLQLISSLPDPAYKERAFSLLLQIVDKNGGKATLANSASFSILLFTTESPPKLLKVNTSGDKVMRGTTDADGNSSIFFRKIVIKEVTSHFRNGCFFLVVSPKNSNNIEPLIIPNFIIKARKLAPDNSLRKKIKLDEEVPQIGELV